MPELPEVETIVRQLDRMLRGAVVESVVVHRREVIRHGRSALQRHLKGRRIEGVEREGKRIIVKLSPPAVLVCHLGMTGRLMMVPVREPIDKHEHVCVRLVRRSQELRFRDPRRFGGLWFANGDGMRSAIPLRPLGPDALSIRLPVLRTILQRKRQIKALLLDQQAIGGLGNIYCDEALFASRIHPLTQACELTEEQVRSLARSIRTTLRASIASGGTTFSDYRGADGSEGTFQRRLRVYGREGEECRRCRVRIERITAAGRSTCLCPHCQRLS